MSIFFFNRKVSQENSAEQELLEALDETRQQLMLARNVFERSCEPDMIDASVYEINALQNRYSFLLKQAREQDISRRGSFRQIH